MTTLKTRALSVIAIIALLISMLACFVVPASADDALFAPYHAILSDIASGGANLEAAVADAEATATTLLQAAQADKEAGITWKPFDWKTEPYPRYAYHAAYEAAGYKGPNWTIAAADDWAAISAAADAVEIGGVYLADHIFHLSGDVDFSGAGKQTMIGYSKSFAGTINGHGFGFDNFVWELTPSTQSDTTTGAAALGYISKYVNAGMFHKLKGATFTDFGINSGSFTFNGNNGDSSLSMFGSTMDNNQDEPYGGANGLSLGKSTFTRIWNYADMTTKGGGRIGGLLAYSQDGGHLINGFIHTGKISCATAGGFYAVTGDNTRGNEYYNIVSAPSAGLTFQDVMARAYRSDLLVNASGNPVYDKVNNFYGVGYTQAFGYRDGAGITSKIIEEDNVRLLASSALEAAWRVNSNQSETDDIENVYYTLDASGNIRFGTKENRIVRVLVRGDDIDDIVVYHTPGKVIDLANDFDIYTGKGTTFVANSGALQVTDEKITLPSSDVIVDVVYSPKAQLTVYKAKVQALLEKYEKIDAGLVYDPEAMESFKTEAQAAIANDDLDMLKALVDMEPELNLGMVNQYPQYPNVIDFDKYQEINTDKNWLIKTAQDWLYLVERSKTTADGFKGHTFHLANDIDFNNVAMAPLSYGGVFRGNIDGHNYSFKNVKILATELSGSSPIGLISKAAGVTVQNLGLASGEINADGSDSQVYCGAFIGMLDAGGANMIRCWNGATITADQTTSGDCSASALIGIPGQNHLLVNGFYNVGTINGNNVTANECYVGVIHNGKHVNYGSVGVFNALHAGSLVLTNAVNAKTAWGRVNASVSGPNQNCYSLQSLDVIYYGTPKAEFNYDINSATAEQYASGELAYLMNQGAMDAVGYQGSGNSYKGENIPPVYFTMKNGAFAFAAEDGSDQMRKITFVNAGAVVDEIYVPAGSVVTLNVEGVISYDSIMIGNKSNLINDNTILELANEDVTINVSVDLETDLAAKIETVEALLQKHPDYITPDILKNSEEYAAWKVAAQNALDAQDPAALNAVIASEPTLELKDDFWPAYSDYDKYKDYNIANNWGIVTADDWVAMLDYSQEAEGNTYFGGYTFHLVDDVDFANAGVLYPMGNGTNHFAGTIDGHGYGFSNLLVQISGSGTWKPLSSDGMGLFYHLGACELRDFGINSGEFVAHGYGGGGCASTFGVAKGPAKLIRVWSGVKVRSTSSGHAVALVGNSENAGLTINGAYFYGLVGTQSKVSFTVAGAAYSDPAKGNTYKNIISDANVRYNTNSSLTSGKYEGTDTITSDYGFAMFRNPNLAAKIENVYGITGEGKVPYSYANITGSITSTGFHNSNVSCEAVVGDWLKADVLEAAWAINNAPSDTDPVYFTLKNGNIRPTTDAALAIRKVTVMEAGSVSDVFYRMPGEYELNYEGATGYRTTGAASVQDNVLTLGAGDAVVEIVRCKHENGIFQKIDGTETHKVSCPDCGSVDIVESCSFDFKLTPNDDLEISSTNRITQATHTKECRCGNFQIEDCEYKNSINTTDCTQDRYYVFECCGRENATIEGLHFPNHNWSSTWTDEGNGKESRPCTRCAVKQYRTMGEVKAEAQDKVSAGDTVEVLVTLPVAMTQGTIQLNADEIYEIINVVGDGFAWTEGATTVTLTAPAAAGATFTVTLKADRFETVADGVLNVRVTGAKNGDETITDASFDAAIVFERILGDADGDTHISLFDPVLALQHAVDRTVAINKANADLDGDDAISPNDALAIVKLWLKA